MRRLLIAMVCLASLLGCSKSSTMSKAEFAAEFITRLHQAGMNVVQA